MEGREIEGGHEGGKGKEEGGGGGGVTKYCRPFYEIILTPNGAHS
jgi:hypothetical protein